MPRIRTLTMDGLSVRISPMSYDETEAYLDKAKELRDRDPKPTDKDWEQRALQSVCLALNKGSGKTNGEQEWTVEKVKAELDMPFVNYIQREFLVMSGLRADTAPGEGQATPTSTSN